MRTTLTLDPVILTAAKEVAKETHRSVGAVISDWAARGLKASVGVSGEVRKSSAAQALFPVFDVPPDSSPITSQRVKLLLEEEGL